MVQKFISIFYERLSHCLSTHSSIHLLKQKKTMGDSRPILESIHPNETLHLNGFEIQFSLLPSVYRRLQRFLRYRDGRQRRRSLGILLESDVLVVRFQPYLHGFEMVMGEEVDALVLETLQQIGIPDQVPVDVFLQITNRENQQVGGQSSISRHYDHIDEFRLLAYLETLSEIGYTGFSVSDVVLEFSFPLRSLLPLLVRGGCKLRFNELVPLEESHCRATEMDITIPPLCDYTEWDRVMKSRYFYLVSYPNSVDFRRGIFFYGWKSHWNLPLCGWMSLVYALSVFRYRRAKRFVLSQLPTHIIETERRRMVDFQSDPQTLYDETLAVLSNHLPPGTEMRPASIGDLASYVSEHYPDANLTIYDETSRAVYRLARKDRTGIHPHIVGHPMPPFTETNPVRAQTILDYFETQIALYYDSHQCHFYPIFSLVQFFARPRSPSSSSPSPKASRTRDDSSVVSVDVGIEDALMDTTDYVSTKTITPLVKAFAEESRFHRVETSGDDFECVGVSELLPGRVLNRVVLDEPSSLSENDHDEMETELVSSADSDSDNADIESANLSDGVHVQGKDIPWSFIKTESTPTPSTVWERPKSLRKGQCLRCQYNICHNRVHIKTRERYRRLSREGGEFVWPKPFPPQRPFYDPGCIVCRHGLCHRPAHCYKDRGQSLPIVWLPPRRRPKKTLSTGDKSHTSELTHHPNSSVLDYVYPCPSCEFRLQRGSVNSHVCKMMVCSSCAVVLRSPQEYEEHCSFSTDQPFSAWVCTRCFATCYSDLCLAEHVRHCVAFNRSRCVYCREHVDLNNASHKCRSYYCFTCQAKVNDPIRYDPLSERYVRGLHTCSMRPPNQRFTDEESLVLDLYDVRVFAFDFESCLDPIPHLQYPFDLENMFTNTIQNPVYLHRVNCASLVELDLSSLVLKLVPPEEAEDRLRLNVELLRKAYQYHQKRVSGGGRYSHAIMQTVGDLGSFWERVVEYSLASENYWYAHNMKAYDGRLLYDFLLARNIYPTRMFWMGQKVMHLEYIGLGGRRIIFRDSVCHVAMSLSKLPKMFGLDETMVHKGMFPYKMNRLSYQSHLGAFPDISLFETLFMTASQYKTFVRWYGKMKDKSIQLLQRVLNSSNLLKDKLASGTLCLDDYDRVWLDEDVRKAVTDHWYDTPMDHRYFEACGIYHLQTEMVRYCENDVLVLASSLLKYAEVCCQSVSRVPLKSITIPQFTYQIYQQLYMPPDTICYLDHNESRFARRALRGGNTNVRRLYYETPRDRSTGARYIDIQSLYPAVQYYDKLPVGRPRIVYYTSIDKEKVFNVKPSLLWLEREFFGFIECDLALPHDEHVDLPFHPVLCLRSRVRNHTTLLSHYHSLERVVLTSVELQAALKQGYRIKHVYRTDTYASSRDVFKPFVKKWLRLKIINSSVPAIYRNDIKGYVKALNKRYQFETPVTVGDFEYVMTHGPNVAMRGLAKLILNSLWGKFGQRTDLVNRELLMNGNDVFRLNTMISQGWVKEKKREFLRSGEGMVTPIQIAHVVNYLKRERKNVAIAAFVTANARLRLFQALQKLDDRVLYHDTDSVIYECPRQPSTSTATHPYLIEEGIFLGDWESETGSTFIDQFVSLAPKTYAYRYPSSPEKPNDFTECVKGKGCLMNRETSSWVQFDSYVYLLCAQFLRSPDPLVVTWFKEYVQQWPKCYAIAKEMIAYLDEAMSVSPEQCDLLSKCWSCSVDTDLSEDPNAIIHAYQEQCQRPWKDILMVYILRHLSIPSRMLLFKRLSEIGETVTFLLKKSFKFDYIKGEIDVATMMTYPFGAYQYSRCRFDYMDKMCFFYKDHLISLSTMYPRLNTIDRLLTGIGQVQYDPITVHGNDEHPYEDVDMDEGIVSVPQPHRGDAEARQQFQAALDCVFFQDLETTYLTEGAELQFNIRSSSEISPSQCSMSIPSVMSMTANESDNDADELFVLSQL